MEEEQVHIKVSDKVKGDVIFEGQVSVDITPGELVKLGCFPRGVKYSIRNKATGARVTSFKGGTSEGELVATYGGTFEHFCGVLYETDDRAVLKKSKSVPSCEGVTMMCAWDLSHEECEKLFRCATLEVLEVNWCHMRLIPQEIGAMKTLKKLTLYGMIDDVMCIPEEIGNLSNLTDLWIGQCAMSFLPATLGRLSRLEKLTFSYLNNVHHIPEEMGQLSRLQELHISDCMVDILPKSMVHLNSLHTVTLHHVWNLHFHPEDLVVFSKLKHLRVSSCPHLSSNKWILASFCDMLRMSTSLRSIQLVVPTAKQTKIMKALRENGSIVERMGTHDIGAKDEVQEILSRNEKNRARAAESVACMMAIKRYKRGLVDVPREVVEMIGKMLWIARCDIGAWS